MFKQLTIMLIISAIVVLLSNTVISILKSLGHMQHFFVAKLTAILPAAQIWSVWVSKFAIIILVPALISMFIAFVYWLIKRRELPRLLEVIWVVWGVSLLVFIMYK